MEIPKHKTCCCPVSVSIDSLTSSFNLLDYLYASKFDNDPVMATNFSSLDRWDMSDISSSPDVEICPHTRALFQTDFLNSYLGDAQLIPERLDTQMTSQDHLFPELSQRLEDDILEMDLDFDACEELNVFSNGNVCDSIVGPSYPNNHLPRIIAPSQNTTEQYNNMDDLVPSPTKSEEDMFCYDDDEERLERSNRRPCKKRKEKRRRRLNSEDSDTDDSVDSYPHLQPKREKRHQATKSRSVENSHHANKSKAPRPIHLYQFLIDLLRNEEYCPRYINWVSRDEGIFRLVDSAAVAQLWGQCKNRENMTYEKMSRALRYYYENGILERVPNCRLQYRFGKVVYEEYGDLL